MTKFFLLSNKHERRHTDAVAKRAITGEPMLLKDRVALITGSGRGIGRAIAQLFAAEGAAVFLTARTEKELSATAEEIAQGGGRAAFVTGDLAKEADCRAVFEKAIASFGRVDILVNNGGHYGPVVPVEEYPMEEFDRVLAVHLRTAFLLSKLVLPGMYERRRGVIVNISSISAKAAYRWGSAYAAAKAGLLGLTRYNAAEAARKGVRVRCSFVRRRPAQLLGKRSTWMAARFFTETSDSSVSSPPSLF